MKEVIVTTYLIGGLYNTYLFKKNSKILIPKIIKQLNDIDKNKVKNIDNFNNFYDYVKNFDNLKNTSIHFLIWPISLIGNTLTQKNIDNVKIKVEENKIDFDFRK